MSTPAEPQLSVVADAFIQVISSPDGRALLRAPRAHTPLTNADIGIGMAVELNDFNTVSATAAYLGYSEKQIRDWLADGSLTGERWGRQWRITREAVEAFIEMRRRASIPPAATTAATAARARKTTTKAVSEGKIDLSDEGD